MRSNIHSHKQGKGGKAQSKKFEVSEQLHHCKEKRMEKKERGKKHSVARFILFSPFPFAGISFCFKW